MDRIRKSIDDGRERTDSSLGAERATGTVAAATGTRTRRQFSDLIEHDRLIVDEQLVKFRDRADRLLARQCAMGAAAFARSTRFSGHEQTRLLGVFSD
jgi:hypothetical protein